MSDPSQEKSTEMPKRLFNRQDEHGKIYLYLCFCMLGLFAVTGCSPLTTVRQDGSTVRHYIGYVRVISPPTASEGGDFSVMEISMLGLRMGKGVGIGYFHERNEYIPLDCRMVIRVADKKQLERVFEVLSQTRIMEEGLCVTVSP